MDVSAEPAREALQWARRWCLGALTTGAALLMGSGCGEQFEPYWSVDDYRILAIRSEPVTLKPGDLAQITVVDSSDADEVVDYQWSWCPVEPSAQNAYECPVARLADESPDVGTSSGADAGGKGGFGQFDPSLLQLGTGSEVYLPYPGTREQVLGICRQIQEAVAEAGENSPFGGSLPTENCQRGFDISVRLKATTEGGRTEIAKKDVTLWTGSEEFNENPEHGGIEIRVASKSDIPKARADLEWVPEASKPRSKQWHGVGSDEPTPILAGMPFDLRADVSEKSAQKWQPPAPAGSDGEKPPPERERLVFRWFLSRGDIEDAQRIYIPGENDFSEVRRSGLNVSKLPDEACANKKGGGGEVPEKCRLRIWSVVRDGRLGLDFAEAELKLVGKASEGKSE